VCNVVFVVVFTLFLLLLLLLFSSATDILLFMCSTGIWIEPMKFKQSHDCYCKCDLAAQLF
jgi:hypothetical protein